MPREHRVEGSGQPHPCLSTTCSLTAATGGKRWPLPVFPILLWTMCPDLEEILEELWARMNWSPFPIQKMAQNMICQDNGKQGVRMAACQQLRAPGGRPWQQVGAAPSPWSWRMMIKDWTVHPEKPPQRSCGPQPARRSLWVTGEGGRCPTARSSPYLSDTNREGKKVATYACPLAQRGKDVHSQGQGFVLTCCILSLKISNCSHSWPTEEAKNGDILWSQPPPLCPRPPQENVNAGVQNWDKLALGGLLSQSPWASIAGRLKQLV